MGTRFEYDGVCRRIGKGNQIASLPLSRFICSKTDASCEGICSVDFDSQESQLIAKHDEPVKCVAYCAELSMSSLSTPSLPPLTPPWSLESVISASWDSTLKVTPIDPSTRQPSPSLTLPLPDKAYSLSLSTSKIVVAMGSRHVYIYDIPTLQAALEEKKDGKDVEVWSKRESNLKFMTRSIACMPDDTGTLVFSFYLTCEYR